MHVDIVFETLDERIAWDRYVAGLSACIELDYTNIVEIADNCILERRARSAKVAPYILSPEPSPIVWFCKKCDKAESFCRCEG